MSPLRQGRLLGVVTLVLLTAITAIPMLPGRDLVRYAWFDACQLLAPRTRLSGPVVIVDVDDRSLARHGQWPWPRTLLAQLVDRLVAAKPAAIGIDAIMPEPDRLSPALLPALLPSIDADLAARLAALPSNDTMLARALADRPVVLGMAGVSAVHAAPGGAVRAAPARVVGGDPAPYLRAFETTLRSLDEIDRAAAGHGLLNVELEGGAVRRVPLAARVGDVLVPALSMEMFRVASGAPGFVLAVGPHGITQMAVGALAVPTQVDGSVWLHYARHTPDRFVSAADVLAGTADPRLFERKLVLFGVTALGLSDRRPIPGGGTMDGVEIHAELIEGMFDGGLLRRPGWAHWVESAFLAAAGALVILLLPRLRTGAVLLLLVPILALAGLGSLALFYWRFLLFDALTPTVGVAIVFGASLSTTLAETERERADTERQGQFVKRAFQQFVSPEVVDRIVRDPGALQFGGELRTLTVLFSDIRDFTTFAERHEPQVVVGMLREYLTEMTRIVIEEGGTLDKYIGDAVMAEFGAPVAYSDHALRGCRAALRMNAEVERLAVKWAAEGREPLRIGLGVNTGTMVVGNLGSEQLFDYTVIGDEVNLGARLEALNKDYQTSTHIIISEATHAAAGGAIQTRRLGEVKVKGKTRPVVVYELQGLSA